MHSDTGCQKHSALLRADTKSSRTYQTINAACQMSRAPKMAGVLGGAVLNTVGWAHSSES
eukprot:274199-Pleurochrysis_carterae.AAC.3